MRLSSLTLHNFGPFRGTHTIELTDTVYAVVAKHADDEERSNWLGKTTWMYAAAPFLLFGVRPPSARNEDAWITDGESEGYVEGMFDTNLRIKRMRRRGKSTQLEVQGTSAPKPLTKQPAQDTIEKILGLSKEDFFNSAFFKQKSMDKFITARSSDRMAIAAAWFNLGPLQSCEENLRARLNLLIDQDEELAARRAALQESANVAFENIGIEDPTAETIAKLKVDLEGDVTENKKVVAELRAELTKHAEWQASAEDAKRYAKVVTEGKALAGECDDLDVAKLDAELEALNERRAKADADVELADRAADLMRDLSAHGFDGRCPVTQGDCPESTYVNYEIAQAEGRIEDLEKQCIDAKASGSAVAKQVAKKRQLIYEARDKVSELETMRSNVKRLMPAHKLIKKKGQPPERGEMQSKHDTAELVVEQSAIAVDRVQTVLANLSKWEKEVKAIAKKRKKLDTQIQIHRESLIIVGRNGAQRRKAERSLAEIERDANALLNETGIDLGIDVMWSREASSGLATSCDQCGAPYPRSQKQKVCHKCGADRPKKTIDKLDIELSDHSGAAEDLAGVAFQLAAAAWLRRERGTDWSIAFIDEPFSHLDACHVKKLSTHFAAMLKGRYGFEQSFVVAHDRSIMDALPGRIEIVATDKGSSFG